MKAGDKVPVSVRLDKTLVDQVYAQIRDKPVLMGEVLEWGLALVLRELARGEGIPFEYHYDKWLWLEHFIRRSRNDSVKG